MQLISDPSLLSEEGGTSNERVFIILLSEVMSVAMYVWYSSFVIICIRKGMGRETYTCTKERNWEDVGPS